MSCCNIDQEGTLRIDQNEAKVYHQDNFYNYDYLDHISDTVDKKGTFWK